MTFTTPSSDPDTGFVSQVVYRVDIHDASPAGHWLAVDMIRSSGARFDTTLNQWTIELPADSEPLFAPGRIGEALLRGAVSLETLPESDGSRNGDRPRATARSHRRARPRHRVRTTTV